MTERMRSEDSNFVLDNGATSFAPVSRYLVQDGIDVDPRGAVEQRNNEWHKSPVAQHPAGEQECGAVAEKAGLHDIQPQRQRGTVRAVIKQLLEPLPDALGIALQIPERHREPGQL